MTDPTPAEIQQVFALETLWTAAHHTAFQRFHRSLFTCKEPWKSSDKKQQRRWKAFRLMSTRLAAAGIDPRQWCAAIAAYHAKKARDCPHSPMKYFPSPAQAANVQNPKVQAIWKTWHDDELEKGYYDTKWVKNAALKGTQTPQEKLRYEIYRAYLDCEQSGTDAPSLDWGPELVWLFWITEPGTRPVFRYLLDELKRTDLKEWESWNQEFKRIKENVRLKNYLLRLKTEATGKPLIRTLHMNEFFADGVEEGGRA